MGIVPENMCTKFDANTSNFRLFEVRGKFWGDFPPMGVNRGEFRKKNKKYATWILCQRTCVPKLTQIQAFLDCLKSGESLRGISPPGGERGGISEKIKNISHGYCAREHVYHN